MSNPFFQFQKWFKQDDIKTDNFIFRIHHQVSHLEDIERKAYLIFYIRSHWQLPKFWASNTIQREYKKFEKGTKVFKLCRY